MLPADARNLRVLPTYHPALVLRQKKWTGVFRIDLGRAMRWFTGKLGWTDPRVVIRPTPAMLRAFVTRPGASLAYDVETDAKESLVAKIRCFGIGTPNEVYVIPLLGIDGMTQFYTQADEAEIREILRQAMSDRRLLKIGHNAGTYDRTVCEQQLNVTPRPLADTIVIHRDTDPEMPHTLGFVGTTLTDIVAWKADLSAVAPRSDEELWERNWKDVAVTARVIDPLMQALQLRDQVEVCKKDHKVQQVCWGMHRVGMRVDPVARNEHDRRLLGDILKYRKILRDVVGNPDFNPNSVPQVGELLFETWGLPPIKMSEKTGAPSTDDESIREYLIKYNLTKEQRLAIDALRRVRYAVKLRGTNVVKLRGVKEAIPDDGLWIDMDETEEERNYRRKRDGKTHGILLADGRLHSSWNSHVAKTGRLSSSDPAVQNWDRALRNMIVASPGHALVGADSDQIELRFSAMNWQLGWTLANLRAGKDPHTETTMVVFGKMAEEYLAKAEAWAKANGKKSKEHKDWKRIRDFTKRLRYAVQYGALPETCHQVITSVEDDAGNLIYADVTLDQTRNRRQALLDVETGYEVGWEHELRLWRRDGFLREPIWGRRADFLDGGKPGSDHDWRDGAKNVENEVKNFRTQCVPGFTRVLTDRGYVPISELVGAGRFRAWTGTRWASAVAVEKGEAELWRVKTSRGTIFHADASHSVLVPTKAKHAWRRLDMIKGSRTRIALDLARPLDFGRKMDREDAYHLGLWLAEGSAAAGTENDVVFAIANNDRRVIARFVRWARARGMRAYVDRSRKCLRAVVHVGGAAWLQTYGADPAWRSHTKRVPEAIWRADLEARKAFLRGFLDGDGNNGVRISIHLCQRRLLEELWLLFRTVGVDAGRIVGPQTTDRHGHVAYELHLSASQVWEHLRWGRESKLRTSTEGTVPWWAAQQALSKLTPTNAADAVILSRLRCGKSTTSAYILRRMGYDEGFDYAFATSVARRRVVVPVYTLMVDDPDHRYVAEGVISKNSGCASIIHEATFELLDAIPFEKWGPGTGLIHQGHDALIVECPESEAKWVADVLTQCMTRTYPKLGDIPFKGEAKIGHRWSEV